MRRHRSYDGNPVMILPEPRMETVRVCPEPFMRDEDHFEVTFTTKRQQCVKATRFDVSDGFVHFSEQRNGGHNFRPFTRPVLSVVQDNVYAIERKTVSELFTPECYEREVPRRASRNGF